MTNRFILCADDFAYNESTSAGIIELAEKKRINAISCMSTMPLWPKHAKKLASLSCQVGLHINLTENQRRMPISIYNMQVHLSLINQKKVKQEIERQFHAFCDAHQRLPDFLDGHQHVQHLPYIRDFIVELHQNHLKTHNSWVRVSANPIWQWHKQPYWFKQGIVFCSGYIGLCRRLKKYKIARNSSFAGIYPLQGEAFRPLFQRFLAATKPQGLIMCHPGLPQTKTHDPIGRSRALEYQYFLSDDFIEDTQAVSLSLV